MTETAAARIERKLTRALKPTRIRVLDESAKHVGHAGARPGGETHFHVEMVSPAFAGLSRLERQRRVHAVLAEELADRVHALSMKLSAPDDSAQG